MNDRRVDYSFLSLESVCHESGGFFSTDRKTLLVSLNPDLVDDFGHFLNYERRIREACQLAGTEYLCFSNRKVSINDVSLVPVFDQDSGYYSLTRASAKGIEAQIALEFFSTVISTLESFQEVEQYETIWLFLYCGSSRLASALSEFCWGERIYLCVNAFWDFLLPEFGGQHLPRLFFQRTVRLLAMSDLHKAEIRDATGLSFDAIPNPPPLISDVGAYKEIRAQVSRACRDTITGRVLVPGLMTKGKGMEATLALFKYLQGHAIQNVTFVFRDRSKIIDCCRLDSPDVVVLTDDLSDIDVIELYRSADVAVLPYESEVFGVRTSGALVDCLVFGVIPLVLQGTWLAHICTSLDFGYVLADMSPEKVTATVNDVLANARSEKARVFRAAGCYLVANSWQQLLSVVVGGKTTDSRDVDNCVVLGDESLLSVANRHFREGRYDVAARIYCWLSTMSDLDIYRFNLGLCERKSGLPKDILIRQTR